MMIVLLLMKQLETDQSGPHAVESSTPLSQTPLSIRASAFTRDSTVERNHTVTHRHGDGNKPARLWSCDQLTAPGRFLRATQRLLQDAQRSALSRWPQTSQQVTDRPPRNLQTARGQGVKEVRGHTRETCVCVCVCDLVAVQQCLGGGGAQSERRV